MSQQLRGNTTLKALNLSNNAVGNDGALSIADSLCHRSGGVNNTTLTSLSLSSTRLQDEGVSEGLGCRIYGLGSMDGASRFLRRGCTMRGRMIEKA